MTPQQIVADVLQRVYGDAAQTVLDHQAASEILAALREAGWASLDEVAAIIMAAGGRVELTDAQLRDIGTDRVTVFRSSDLGGVTFTARRAADEAERMVR